MAIRYLKTHAVLEGHVGAEDAEALVAWIRRRKAPAVHLGDCEHLHAAVLQVLLALRPAVKVPPRERWLAMALGV
ncbi:hypothetical protein LOC51_04610 [Rubrivivax sp. JA1024]|nr:hypothetical protein [Rubrivivax sp. JA1024]